MNAKYLAIAFFLLASGCGDPYRGFDQDPARFARTSCADPDFAAVDRIARGYAREKLLEFRVNPVGPLIALVGPRFHFVIDQPAGRTQLTQFMRSHVRRGDSDESAFQDLLRRLNTCGQLR